MSDSVVIETRVGRTSTLTLNRPKAMNALNLAIVERFEELLEDIANDDEVRVLLITGAGSAFCAGADLKEVLATSDLETGESDFLDRVCDNVMNVIREFPKPVIAVINGLTMAGGLELAMCCDIILAAAGTKIGDAHANFGVFPGAGGAAILPRLLPQNIAKYLLFTGDTLSAEELHAYGLVNQVYSSEELLPAAQKLADRIAGNSPIALRRMKEVANRSSDGTRAAALEHEQMFLRAHMRSYDMQEGLAAFAEKRRPKFKGK